MWDRVSRFVVIVFPLFILVACSSIAPPEEITAPDMGLVFGHIESDMPIDKVDLQEYGVIYIPPFTYPPRVLVYDNGTFMAENLKPAKYVLVAFHAGNKVFTLVNDERSAYQHIVQVKPGQLNYAGSYRVTVTKKNLFGKGDFEVDELQRPTERDLLKDLFRLTQGTGWQKKIERRMKELRQ